MDALQLTFARQRDVEKLFAAAAYTYPLYTLKMCGWLQPGDLLHEQVRDYWQSLTSRLDANMDDDEALSIAIQAATESGLHSELNDWQGQLGYSPMPQAYAAEIARRQYLSKAVQLNNRLAMELGRGDTDAAQSVISDLGALTRRGGARIDDAAATAMAFEKMLDGDMGVIETFIPALDVSTGGLDIRALTTVAGRPSMGKTALIWQIARSVAVSGKHVLFVSLEMSKQALWARAACPLVGITWRDVKSKRVNAEKITELKNESRRLAEVYGNKLHIIDTPQTTESLWQLVAELRPSLIVADHLRLFGDKHTSEVKRLGIISQRCKEIGKAFSAAFLLAVQLSRDTEKRADKRPQLSDMRDSGEIEENADAVWMLYRDEYYSNTGRNTGKSMTEVWIRKFREGPSNIVARLNYDMERQWFE